VLVLVLVVRGRVELPTFRFSAGLSFPAHRFSNSPSLDAGLEGSQGAIRTHVEGWCPLP